MSAVIFDDIGPVSVIVGYSLGEYKGQPAAQVTTRCEALGMESEATVTKPTLPPTEQSIRWSAISYNDFKGEGISARNAAVRFIGCTDGVWLYEVSATLIRARREVTKL